MIYESPGYIPLDSITIPEIKKVDYPCKEKWKIKATLWKNKSLCHILGFPSLYMPVFATLCGNDYIDSFKIPMEFVKEYTKTLINFHIIDQVENSKYNSKIIIRNIKKEVNLFNNKDTLKEALDEFPKVKKKIDDAIKTYANKIKSQNNKSNDSNNNINNNKNTNLISLKEEDLYNIANIIYKKNYFKVLIEYLKKKITLTEKQTIPNSNSKNISQERDQNKEKLIKSLILEISIDKSEPDEQYQKLFDLTKVYISNDKYIEKYDFNEYINKQNISKISDYFLKGMFYGKSLKGILYILY